MYVYVITNPSFDGWVKVGKSEDPKARADGMKTNAPTRYVLEYQSEYYCDRPVHCYLTNNDIERSLEWFKCDVKTAISAIETVIAETPDYVIDSLRIKQERERAFDAAAGEVRFT